MDTTLEQEKKRLELLFNLNVLHTTPEERFDRIIRAAKNIFKTPYVGIALMDTNAFWFKSIFGTDISETKKGNSIFLKALEAKDTTVLSESTAGEVFKTDDFAQKTGVKFFAIAPLITTDGFALGILFVADTKERMFREEERMALADLSLWVLDELLAGRLISEDQKMRRDLVSRNLELAREKAKSDAMLTDIGDAVVGINDRGLITFANQQVEEMTGYKKDELVGKLLIQALKMVDAKGEAVLAVNQPIRQAIFYNKKVTSRQYSYVRSDGTKFPVAITATPIVVYNNIVGGVVVFRDITKELEVDRMKTEFISLASHQLRTPLSAMKWFAEILLDGDAGELTAEQKELLNNIYTSNERMIDLVNTLLNISRIESGRIVIDPRPTDLKKLVDEVVVEMTPKLKQKKQHLAVSVHGQLPMISVDPKLVRHVYLNLLTNAIKYSGDGTDIVVIISKSGDSLVSQVSDSGLGIPLDQQEKVFKKFFRANNVVKVETDGTGLGLYLAHAIVESSGGKIWFKSIPGKGTTFWFSLPFVAIKKEGEVSID